jgi:hypothetical protein
MNVRAVDQDAVDRTGAMQGARHAMVRKRDRKDVRRGMATTRGGKAAAPAPAQLADHASRHNFRAPRLIPESASTFFPNPMRSS